MNILNYRDLGGITNKEGKRLKKGLIHRGGPLVDLDKEAKEYIDSLKLKHIIDFRDNDEFPSDDDLYVPNNCEYENISASNNYLFDSSVLGGTSNDWLIRMYELLPYDNLAYKKVFSYLKKGELPIYYHCAYGKDRTGVCTALILTLLDVNRDEIYEDYMESLKAMLELHKDHLDTIPHYYLLERKWLESMFNEFDKNYPNKDEYFLKEFGITAEDKKRIKDLCLEQ